uniref:DUF4757 domain-containing protein n=2 Tax=Clastoptera arizonana TaxID=38151 RepID=A0A1B6E150_9HEMI
MPAEQPGVMQRRHSSASSSDAASDHGMNSGHTSQENVSLIPTRTTKVITSKPAANPLQFIKVGPCDLYRTAQEQLKKVEEVKKVKQERRDEAEDWQSNLDNWKCSRRKRQEHIIERVVEVKKLELEEFDRNRRRSKTFNEMMEERNTKGRKLSLPVYNDDNNDLSELGIGSSKHSNGGSDKNGEDNVFDEVDKESNLNEGTKNSVKQNGVMNGHSSDNTKRSSNDIEEYTYERAIQSYVNFTESRNRGRSSTPSSEDSKITNGTSKRPSPPIPVKPRRNSCKIEEKLSELEEIKKKSVSTTELNNDARKKSISVPKVDILKRRELFEKSPEDEQNSKLNRISGDFSSSKSIRERLFSLEKQSDENTSSSTKKISCEVSVKGRLSNIEQNTSKDNKNNSIKSNQIIQETKHKSVKDRLSSLQKESDVGKVSQNIISSELSIKDRLTSLDAACHKEIPRTVNTKEEVFTKSEKLQETGKKLKNENVERAFSPEEEVYETKRQQHYRHRSLDSLDIDSTEGLGNESFDRVQSLEDLDFCRNYPASSFSGDTDREDSGINTADVSSSVSQADDCDLHLDDDIKLHHQPPIMEEISKQKELETKTETNDLNSECDKQISVGSLSEVDETDLVVVESLSSVLRLPLKLDIEPLPVILESPSEPHPAFEIVDNINETNLQEETVCDQIPISPINDTLSEVVCSELKSDSDELNTEDQLVDEITDISSEVAHNSLNCTLDSSSFSNIEDIALLNSVNNANTSGDPSISVSNVPNEVCMQDKTACSGAGENERHTVVEVCYKVDSNQLTSPTTTSVISVDTEPNFDVKEKQSENFEMSNTVQLKQPEDELKTKAASAEDKPSIQVQSFSSDILKEKEVEIQATDKTINVVQTVETFPSVDKFEFPIVDSDISNNIHETNTFYMNNDYNINGDVVFPLSPTALEPPREKPPPPPTTASDDDDSIIEKSSPLRRLDSTKRIKKEIRQKRSSFLGLNDGLDDDSYLEPELDVRPPPDMTNFLAEERRLEQMLYRQSICSESDSNQESRDSGVELEKHSDELTWSHLHHSRDNSETYANTSTTSEEEEIVKKEREIIEILEQEEMNRYSKTQNEESDNIGEKLTLRLRELEQEKANLEWQRHQEIERRRAEENMINEHNNRIHAQDEDLQKQKETLVTERKNLDSVSEPIIHHRAAVIQQQWTSSLQDVSIPQHCASQPVANYRHSLINVHSNPQEDYRKSMPDLASIQPRRPPPPIPSTKPFVVTRTSENRTSSPQQMSRQTIQALSAAPRSRLISNDNWMQTKRKPKPAQDNYNYQHWLIQEAEHRRITEQNHRQNPPPPRRTANPQVHSQLEQNLQWSQTTPQYTNWQPQKPKPNHYSSPPKEEQQNNHWTTQLQRPVPPTRSEKPLPDSIIQTLTQRVQNRIISSDTNNNNNRRRCLLSMCVQSFTPTAFNYFLYIF